MTAQKKEDFFAYVFMLVLSIAMAMGSLTDAVGVDGWWTPTTKWINSILWIAMTIMAVNMLYRFTRHE